MLLYVVAYDIPDDKRCKKVSDLLEGYGKRVQYSVFECVLSQAKYEELGKLQFPIPNSQFPIPNSLVSR
ncbi:MAG: CRISPR-associated endonuclease Cas2 [Symploca sp. SIO2E6]|nr:CRISPR-associated endonuclease Cas2 [Symploca sp. SIO2E6]